MSARGWLRIVLYSGGLGLAGKVAQFLALTFLAMVLTPKDFGRFAVAQIVVTGVVSILSGPPPWLGPGWLEVP